MTSSQIDPTDDDRPLQALFAEKPISATLTTIKGGGVTDAQADILRNVTAGAEFTMQLAAIKAKLQRHKYLKLIEAGFTESQALELCKDPF